MLKGKKRVKEAIGELVAKKGRGLKAVYLSGLGNIIEQTPADKGRARNNWFLTTNAPSNKETQAESRSGANSHAQLSKMPNSVLGEKIFFTNNISYIGLLEYGGYPKNPKRGSYVKDNAAGNKYQILSINGFSKQAPGGWVRMTLRQMQAKVKTL